MIGDCHIKIEIRYINFYVNSLGRYGTVPYQILQIWTFMIGLNYFDPRYLPSRWRKEFIHRWRQKIHKITPSIRLKVRIFNGVGLWNLSRN